MAEAQKYAFDTEFAPDGEILCDPHGAQTLFSAEDIEKARKSGFELGKQDALAQAERATTAAVQDLVQSARAILAAMDKESHAMRVEAARVAFAAARKIAGEALEGYGAERAASAIDAAMDALRHQPRLIVRLPTKDAETLSPRIEDLREGHAYEGAVLIRADDKMQRGEVVIDWSEGATSIDPQEISERIETLINAALASAAPDSEATP